MSGLYATNTSVSVERTRNEIETMLARYHASTFAYATEPGRVMIGFRIQEKDGPLLAIRMMLPIPAKGEKRFTHSSQGMRRPEMIHKLWEQACRSSWRALLLVIKAKLEACACGISTIEREFMADIVTPSGLTIGEQLRPQLQAMSDNGQTPQLLLSAGAHP